MLQRQFKKGNNGGMKLEHCPSQSMEMTFILLILPSFRNSHSVPTPVRIPIIST